MVVQLYTGDGASFIATTALCVSDTAKSFTQQTLQICRLAYQEAENS